MKNGLSFGLSSIFRLKPAPGDGLEEEVQLVVEARDLEGDAALRRVEGVAELRDLGRVQLLHHQQARAVHQQVQADGVLHRPMCGIR